MNEITKTVSKVFLLNKISATLIIPAEIARKHGLEFGESLGDWRQKNNSLLFSSGAENANYGDLVPCIYFKASPMENKQTASGAAAKYRTRYLFYVLNLQTKS
jgi:hypothetical protein